MSSRLFKYLIVVAALSNVAGCKLAVIAPPGGMIQSTSGSRNCDGDIEGEYCTFDLSSVSIPFTESFTATAMPGYKFIKWQGGDGFLCGNSTNATCTVTIADDGLAPVILASFGMYSIMPVFSDIGIDTDGDEIRNELDEDDDGDGLLDTYDPCPTNPDQACGGDYLIANGKIWFQPDLFTNLDWSTINARCPLGICNGLLKGYNMNGWKWASSSDVVALFASYGSTTGGSFNNCPAVDNFFYDGWRKTNSTGIVNLELVGWTSNSGEIGYVNNKGSTFLCTMQAGDSGGYPFTPTGAWFYRTP